MSSKYRFTFQYFLLWLIAELKYFPHTNFMKTICIIFEKYFCNFILRFINYLDLFYHLHEICIIISHILSFLQCYAMLPFKIQLCLHAGCVLRLLTSNTIWNINVIQIIAILYWLNNNDKNTNLYIFSTQALFDI